MSNPYDAFRKVINHEANQDDDGGFFAKLGGLEPDPEDDGPTARGLFQHWDTERDGPAVKWPPRIDFARNSYVYQYEPEIMPKKSAIDYLIEAFKAPFNQKPKRKHAITVRKLSGWYGNFWKFSCTPCGLSINYPTWETAYHQATHHARTQH